MNNNNNNFLQIKYKNNIEISIAQFGKFHHKIDYKITK